MSQMRSSFVVISILAVGFASGALSRDFFAKERSSARLFEQRMDQQSQAIDRQREALEALASAFRAARAEGDSTGAGAFCLTANDLRAALATGAQPASMGATATGPGADPSLEQAGEHARDEALRVVDRAIGSGGMLTQNEVFEIRSLVSLMTPTQRDQALGPLFKALNEGRLRLAAHGIF